MRFVAERAAIAAVTMASTLLGESMLWIYWDSRHGTGAEGMLMFLGCPFLGAAVAKGVVTFSDARSISFVLVAFGALGGLTGGLTTCPWCLPLRMTPAGITWIAAWSFAGAFFGTLPRFRSRPREGAWRAAVYVFSGFTVLLAIMVIVEIVDDIQRGYKYGLKDVPGIALALVLRFAPAIALVALSWRRLKAAERARMDTNNTGTRAVQSGGPTTR